MERIKCILEIASELMLSKMNQRHSVTPSGTPNTELANELTPLRIIFLKPINVVEFRMLVSVLFRFKSTLVDLVESL